MISNTLNLHKKELNIYIRLVFFDSFFYSLRHIYRPTLVLLNNNFNKNSFSEKIVL